MTYTIVKVSLNQPIMHDTLQVIITQTDDVIHLDYRVLRTPPTSEIQSSHSFVYKTPN